MIIAAQAWPQRAGWNNPQIRLILKTCFFFPFFNPWLRCWCSNHLRTLEGDWGYVSDTLSNAFFGDNSITAIPRSFSTFDALVWLNLDNNNIEEIREDSLPPHLVTLSLNTNLLKVLPPSLAKLRHLEWLYLRGNNFFYNLTFRYIFTYSHKLTENWFLLKPKIFIKSLLW